MTRPVGDRSPSLLGRIVRPVDYVRVLEMPMRLRSPHFAVHHMEGRPLPLRPPGLASAPTAGETSPNAVVLQGSAPITASLSTDLSTDLHLEGASLVEDSSGAAAASGTQTPAAADIPASGLQRWLGLIVPKRHAKRAVTRTLVKRQIRNVVADCASRLEPGLWVVRQRSPFDPQEFPSAASDALKDAARAELRALFERAVRGERDRVKPRGPWPDRKSKSKAKAVPPEGSPCAR